MLQSIADFLKEYGALGLAIHAFIDAIIFPVPAFFTQVSLSLVHPQDALWLATAGFIACLLGTPIGYLLGKLLGRAVLYRVLKKQWIDAATRMFQKNGEAAILIGAFTPIPFKVFTILSGFLNFPLWKLIGYAAIGRAAKFYVVGGLFYLFGRAAESMVKDVSLYLMVTVVPVLLVGIYLKRRHTRKKLLRQAQEQAQVAGLEADGAPVAHSEGIARDDDTTQAEVASRSEGAVHVEGATRTEGKPQVAAAMELKEGREL